MAKDSEISEHKTQMAEHTVQYTGSIFSDQRYGGVSRYILELARNINSNEAWFARIESPFFINEYLRKEQTTIGHGGIYLPRRPIGLNHINSALAWLTELGGVRQRQTVRHEMFFNSRRLELCKSVRVSTFYDMITEKFQLGSHELCRKKRTAIASDAMVAISESTKSDMVDILNIDPNRVKVIYLAAGIGTVSPTDVSPYSPYILWVGNRRGYKNFELLVQAFPRTRAWRDGVKILIVGGGSPSESERKVWVSCGLSPEQIIHVTPSETEIPSLYAFAEMLVYCSKYEGFGIPPLEAMQANCPVICSNTSSLPEVVGDAALQVNPDDVEQLASAIDAIYDSPHIRNDLIQRGIANAKKFSWATCAEEHIKLYNSLL